MSEINFINKTVLITGGCGFIGSHLPKRMLSEGARVFIIARKNTNMWRIKDNVSEVEILETDITDTAKTDSTIKKVEPEYVFHLAAYGVDSAQKEYTAALRNNIMGTFNILNSLKDIGCKKVINMGSCAEYGDRKEIMKEDMLPEPVSVYGSTKACATILAHQVAGENHIDIVTVRPFGVFGEGEERHKIFCHIILSILEDRDVLLTSCEQYRDYCYVENIIDAMVMAAQSNNVKNNILNVASGNLYPLKHYVDLIFKNMKTDKKPLYGAVEYRKNEMWTPTADISRIESMLGWRPRISLEEGIKNTINWYEQNKSMYS